MIVGDAELDELFAADPASFVAARNALTKKAQAAGQHEQASQIHALRKPTMVVWLINQLARRHCDEVAALAKAGKQLREAQLKGLGSTSLREANEAWRVAITAALRRIRGKRETRSDPHLEHASARGDLEPADDTGDPRKEDTGEDPIVEVRKFRVDLALVRTR